MKKIPGGLSHMKVPAPIYKDPIYNGAADPMVIRKESD